MEFINKNNIESFKEFNSNELQIIGECIDKIMEKVKSNYDDMIKWLQEKYPKKHQYLVIKPLWFGSHSKELRTDLKLFQAEWLKMIKEFYLKNPHIERDYSLI